ncbi:hypothetical protein AB0N09_21855 [Streptomyces erythrochromogenes]|uniref:hypothetical protein n=1 Tax=Streptomyces erythrochromogenes TaxID=285574 RepID=UPI00343C8E08
MTATPHPASTAPAHAHRVFRAVVARAGRLCHGAADCFELATVLVPTDPAVRLVGAATLPPEALTAVCAPHAADAARTGRHIREAAAAAALASAQLALFTT